jgi:tRNA threonylcarbamoyl adenosine modification protein (Sua5/YciO/YrdC/YwlC family)/dephospho-CoA kinase
MKTEILTTEIERAAEVIRSGGLVAVPTETVYGLAGNGLDPVAVEKIYEVKGRPAVKPLSLMVPGAQAMELYCRNVPRGAQVLADKFWPGPLTIVLESKDNVPDIVRAGGKTVGLRCPDQAQTLALLRACNLPLAAPSANPSGEQSPKTAQDVEAYFDGKIEAVIDGGPCGIGFESTIMDLTASPYRILRQGALPEADIQDALIRSLRVVGVTGGTGTGKTTAVEALAEMGALVIDADEVYHEMCDQNMEMLARIEARFPGTVEKGVLQRKKLGEVVFNDEKALADLQAVTDEFVDGEICRRMANFAAQGGKWAAVDAIDVVGTSLARYFGKTVGVTAPEELRAQRIMARDGISREYALTRIHAQRPDSFFEENCDYCVRNDGSVGQFHDKCRKIFKHILEDESWTS